MEQEDTDEVSCEQCGLCCRIFGNTITPTPENLFQWIERDRSDILRFFSACKENGTWVNCADLKSEEIGEIVVVEMRDPDSHDYLCACPFLRRVGKRRYLCGIHDTKPLMCCTYKPWIWGETDSGRCMAVARREKKGRWPV